MQKKYLYDVAILRPFAIFLLVLYHSFAPYSGGWNAIEGIPDIQSYWWIGKTSYFCMLELFVFISGYVFAYTSNQIKKNVTLKELVLNKTKRLLIPGLFFSCIYYLLFRDYSSVTFRTPIEIMSGVGHLWFLPMLFWCFILTFFLNRKIENTKVKFAFCILLVPISVIPIPFGISPALYYLFFFYLGYWVRKYLTNIPSKIIVCIVSIITISVFLILTLFSLSTLPVILSNSNTIIHAIGVEISVFCKAICAFLGVMSLFYLTQLYLKKRASISSWIVDANKYCMGIYVYQQFILQLIYYKCELASYVGYYWLPWLGFIVTFVLSSFLAYLTKKTSIGNKLV